MGIENFKRWHWMIIGLLLGAMFGGTRVMWRKGAPEADRSFDRQQFSDQLRRGMEIRNLVLHMPVDGQEWVTGEAFKAQNGRFGPQVVQPRRGSTQPARERAGTWVKFHFLAAEANSSRSVYRATPDAKEYLAALQKEHGRTKDQFAYKEAWWESPSYTVATYTAGGFVLIGLIWPTILNLLSGAGFGRQKQAEDEYDLDRFKSGPEPAAAATAVAGNDQQLADLNTNMEQNVADMMITKTAIEQEDEEEAAAIKQLQTQAMDATETPQAKAEREAREYKGEFYPVAKPTVDKKKDSKS